MDSLDLDAGAPPANLVSDVAELTRKIEDELGELDLSPAFEWLPAENAYRGPVRR